MATPRDRSIASSHRRKLLPQRRETTILSLESLACASTIMIPVTISAISVAGAAVSAVAEAAAWAGCSSGRSEEHTSELQSLMRISYAVFCLKKKKHNHNVHRSTEATTHERHHS